jgi:chromosome segregation ATPase
MIEISKAALQGMEKVFGGKLIQRCPAEGGVVEKQEGKCEEEAKRVLELDAKLEDLRRKLEDLERERDDQRERTKDCPELYRQDEELRRKREALVSKRSPHENQARHDRRIISYLEQQGWDSSEVRSQLYEAEREIRLLDNELANLERQLEKIGYELSKCPDLHQIKDEADERDKKISAIREEIKRTENELKEAEDALKKCRQKTKGG